MQKTITEKQEKVLTFIRDYYLEKGVAPTLLELQEYLGISTKRGVVSHLEALEKKGFIIRTGGVRGIRIQQEEDNFDYLIGIPILGYANAGIPLALAVEDYLGTIKVDKKLLVKKDNLFGVIIKGNSMDKYRLNGVSLKDGNYVIIEKNVDVKNGDVVLVLIDNYATVKIFRELNDVIVLQPCSYDLTHQPIYLDKGRENMINGRVVLALENLV